MEAEPERACMKGSQKKKIKDELEKAKYPCQSRIQHSVVDLLKHKGVHKQNLATQYACKVELLLLHEALKESKSKIKTLHHVEIRFYRQKTTTKQNKTINMNTRKD